MNPDLRRTLRSVTQSLVVLALVGLLYVLAEQLTGEVAALREMARAVLAIVALVAILHGMENTSRAFKLSLGRDGAKVEAEEDHCAAKPEETK